VVSLIAPIVAGRFRDQRAVTAAVLLVSAIGFVGLLTTDVWPTFWVMCVFAGPGARTSALCQSDAPRDGRWQWARQGHAGRVLLHPPGTQRTQ
jgi:hypothetical protein